MSIFIIFLGAGVLAEYSRVDTKLLFKGCLLQNLLSPLLDFFSHLRVFFPVSILRVVP